MLVFSLTQWSGRIPTEFHVLGRTQDTARYNKYFAYGAITLYGTAFQLSSAILLNSTLQSYNPNIKLVWATPVSLAATQGITSFSFPLGT